MKKRCTQSNFKIFATLRILCDLCGKKHDNPQPVTTDDKCQGLQLVTRNL